MRSSNKAAAAALGGVLLLSGCSGSSDVNPYAKIFGIACSASDQGVVCADGELPDVLAAADEALKAVDNLLDQLAGLTETSPLTGLLPIGQISDQLTLALDQATAAINEQLISTVPAEVSDLVDQALVTALTDDLTEVTNLISPVLPDDDQTGDPLDSVRAALAAATNPTDMTSAVTSIQSSLVELQSGLRSSVLLDLADALTAASSAAGDPSALLAGALTDVADALSNGDSEALSGTLQGLTEVSQLELVSGLLESVGGLNNLLNLAPEDLTELGLDGAFDSIAEIIASILGLVTVPAV